MARKRKPEAMSVDGLEAAAGAAVVVGGVSVLVGLGFGLFWMVQTEPGLEYGRLATTHPTLGLGFVTLVFGLVVGVLAWLVALGFWSQARPRRHALQAALAQQRLAEEL